MANRKAALDKLSYMIESLEEHKSEAEKDGNEEYAACLRRILVALYTADLPSKAGQLKLIVDLA